VFSLSAIQKRREKVAQSWHKLLSPNQAIVVLSGSPITKPGGLDQTYPFLPHPCYYWLSGRRRFQEAVVYTRDNGWMDFQNPVSEAEVIWEGEEFDTQKPQNDFKDLAEFLKSKSQVFVMGEVRGVDKALASYIHPESDQLFELQAAFDKERRKKDAEEIQLISRVSEIAHQGYIRLKEIIRPGISEKEIRLEYETTVLRAGADGLPYDTIVGAGTNAAILHAIPTSKIVQQEELVLIDAGAEIQDYCVDITRVFPTSGKFSEQQKAIYDLVLKAQKEAIAACRSGSLWNRVHLTAAKVIAEGLHALNILKVSADEAVATEAISVFFPHGVGHLVGLRVRDVGHSQNIRPKKYGGVMIRIDLELENDHLVTVEPGCYFIKAFLENSKVREKYQNQINWQEVEKWKSIGGVRIEDDILITQSGPRNLTESIEK
jgi:Xaa-Pro aminopeptidase